MALWNPTRREFVKKVPSALAAAALPRFASASPAATGLRFMVLGDWGRRGKWQQRDVASCMQATFGTRGAEFVATTGDNFYNWGVRDKHSSHWRESYVDVYRDL